MVRLELARRPAEHLAERRRDPVPGRFVVSIAASSTVPAGTATRVTTLFSNVARAGSSAGSRSFSPLPSAASTSRTPATSCASSSGTSEAWWSGPYSRFESVKCFSTATAPSATAATDVQTPGVWSERPYGTPSRSPIAAIARRLTSSGGQG